MKKLLWTFGLMLMVPLGLGSVIYVVMGLFYTLNGAWVDGVATMSFALLMGVPALIIGFVLMHDISDTQKEKRR